MERIANGIFMWSSAERRSVRYGAFYLAKTTFDEASVVEQVFNVDGLTPFEGKRVKLTAVVTESRKSGHIGDLNLGIEPSQPKVGETVELGVGTFELNPADDGSPLYTLRPGDGRKTLWIDPRKLYRLHDQTVDLFIEVTEEAFSPAPDLTVPSPGFIALPDGSFQMCGITDESEMKNLVTKASFHRIGDPEDHMFTFGRPEPGRYLKKNLS